MIEAIAEFFNSMEALPSVLFIVGIILLFTEVFIPGFGIAGGAGTVLIIVGILLAADSFIEALILFLVLLALLTLVTLLTIRSVKRGKLSKKLILHNAATQEDGFSATQVSPLLIGKEGISLTVLRPAGIGEFDGERLDVVSEGGFIQAGEKIKIVDTQGRRIVVKTVD